MKMQQKGKFILIFLVLLSVPAMCFAADCFLKISIEDSSDGTIELHSIESAYGNFEPEVNRLKLDSDLVPRQLLLLNQQEGTPLEAATVLARFSTGYSLVGVGEGFTPDLPGLGAGTVEVARGKKTLYLPANPEVNRIAIKTLDTIELLTEVSSDLLLCRKSCLDDGESLLPQLPLLGCCDELTPLPQESGPPICSYCGDGVCSAVENSTTCSSDCKVIPSVQSCPSGVQVLVDDCASLTAHYTFVNRTGGNLARRKYTLDQVGAVSFEAVSNGSNPAAIFPGGRSFLAGGHFDSLPVATVSAWVKPKNSQAKQAIVHFGNLTDSLSVSLVRMIPVFELISQGTGLEANGESLERAPTIQSQSGRTLFRGRSHVSLGKIPVKPDQWTHIALTQEKSVTPRGLFIWKFYVNGKPVLDEVRTNFQPDLSSGATRLFIGVGPKGKAISNGIYTGSVDDVTIWQRVLTAEEILFLAEQGAK